jgi:hypothetical protein
VTLAMLTDKERADLLRDISVLVGLDPDKTTAADLRERVILMEDCAAEWHERQYGEKGW